MGWGGNVFPLLIITPSGGFTGLFLYSPRPGTGNLIGSWTAQGGTDPFGNAYPAGMDLYGTGLTNAGSITASSESMNPGPFLLYGNQNTSAFVFTSSGTFTPTANGTVSVGFYGPGGSGATSGAGGGGEFAGDADTVTSGTPYTITVGTGGSGASTTATFNTKTVTAHAGSNAPGASGGHGGTGSTNATHFNGGNGHGGVGTAGGGGGGGAGGGGAGSNASGTGGGPGGLAGGFNAGGAGGAGGSGAGLPGSRGISPGGGGGGGGFTAAGGAGANGLAVIFFTSSGGSTQLLDSIAQGAGTDPVTGDNYNAGVWNYNPTFTTGAGLSGGALTLTSPSGNTSISSASGYPRASTTIDSNLYDLAVFHLVASPGQTISAIAFPNAVTGATVPVGIGHYRFRCVINCTTANAAGTPQIEFTFPSASGTFMQNYVTTVGAAAVQANQATVSAVTSVALAVGPTLNGHGFICTWEGDFTTTAAGNLALNAITSAVADTYTVATVWLDLYPVS